jgi:hypothetical protein
MAAVSDRHLAEDLTGTATDLIARCHKATIEGRWSTTMRPSWGTCLSRPQALRRSSR